ncbi:MAG: hypothetical protein QM576_06580 [Rhodopseudomonas sp.]
MAQTAARSAFARSDGAKPVALAMAVGTAQHCQLAVLPGSGRMPI